MSDPFDALNRKLNESEAKARTAYGEAFMDDVVAWTAANMRDTRAFAKEVLNAVDPYETAVAAYRKAKPNE